MAAHLLAYHLTLTGPMARLSEASPTIRWHARPAGRRWIVQGFGLDRREQGLDARLAAVGASVLPSRGSDDPVACVVDRSPAERAFAASLDTWDAIALTPWVWQSGRLALHLLTEVGRPPAAWTAGHPNARLIAKRPAAAADLAIGADAAWASPLSPQQRRVLERALNDGYYDVPRRTNVARIASHLAIARSTAEEHLRIAESAVVRSTARLFTAGGSVEPDLAPPLVEYAQFSAALDLYVRMAVRDDRIERVTLSQRPPSPGTRDAHPYLDRIVAHTAGGRDDLRDLPVDLGVSAFDRRVLEEVRRIPPGQTATYGEVARRAGHPRAARAVGRAVARNPVVLVVPCHRVVPSTGGVGEYSAAGGRRTKRRLLEAEGADAPG